MADQVERSRSYKDKRGIIRFQNINDRLSVEVDKKLLKEDSYRKIVERSIRILQDHNVLGRINNHDNLLARYLAEYFETFESLPSPERALLLFTIGMDIEGRLRHNDESVPQHERIDHDLAHILKTFVASNGTYVHGFQGVSDAVDDLERSKKSFERLQEKSHPDPKILIEYLAQTQDIYTDKTKKLVVKFQPLLIDQRNQRKVRPLSGSVLCAEHFARSPDLFFNIFTRKLLMNFGIRLARH